MATVTDHDSIVKTLPIHNWVEAEHEEETRLYITGVAASSNVDSTGDVISENALENALKEYMKFPTIRYMHRPEPVGRVTNAYVKDGQLVVEGYIVDPDVILKVKAGVLTALSIGGWIRNYHFENGHRVIDDLRLVEISVVDVPANPEAVIIEYKGIVPTHTIKYSKDEEASWDADAAEKRIRRWASSDGSGDKDKIDWKKYAQAFAWYDDKDPENFGSYKLPHHDVKDGKFVVVWRGVAAAMAALLGARGGVRIPESDRKKVYNHLAKHYREFGKEPPEYKSLAEILWEKIDQLETQLEALENNIDADLELMKTTLEHNKEIDVTNITTIETAETPPVKDEEDGAGEDKDIPTDIMTGDIENSEDGEAEAMEMGGDEEADVGEPVRRHHSEAMPLQQRPRIKGFFDLIQLKYGGENYE